MSYFTFGVLPYFTILIFLIGMGYRLYIWTKIPQPGALTLFPAPGSGSGVFWGVVKESLLFPGLFKDILGKTTICLPLLLMGQELFFSKISDGFSK